MSRFGSLVFFVATTSTGSRTRTRSVLEDLEDLEDMDFDFFGLEEVAIALDDELWCPC